MDNFVCPVCTTIVDAGVNCITHSGKVYHTDCYAMAYLPLATDTPDDIKAKDAASKLAARGIDRDILRTLLDEGEGDALAEIFRMLTEGKHNWIVLESDGRQWHVACKNVKADIKKEIVEAHNEDFKVKRLWYKGIRHSSELSTVVTIIKTI